MVEMVKTSRYKLWLVWLSKGKTKQVLGPYSRFIKRSPQNKITLWVLVLLKGKGFKANFVVILGPRTKFGQNVYAFSHYKATSARLTE